MESFDELQRAEARNEDLRGRNERLAERLAEPSNARHMAFVGIVLSLLAGTAAFMQGRSTCRAACGSHAAFERDSRDTRIRDDFDEEESVLTSCQQAARKASLDLSQCEDARMRTDPSWRPVRTEPDLECPCQAADPLCACP